jgi:DNA-binding NtrC family response regulator
VILDLVLPQTGGKELYHRFKRTNPAVNVLLFGGFSIAGQAEELLDGGCRGFLQKPYDIQQLSSTVMDILAAE